MTVQLLTLYTNPEHHNAQTEDDIMMQKSRANKKLQQMMRHLWDTAINWWM